MLSPRIVSRGMMGGYTRFLPNEETMLKTRDQLIGSIIAALGGRAAEHVVFDDFSTGASNDIEQVTNIARRMVTVYGMSDKLGPVTLGKREEMVFLGREMGEQRNYGDRTADEIDVEVSKIVSDAWETAVQILRENRARLDRLAKRLVEIETLEGDTLQQLLDGQEPAAAF